MKKITLCLALLFATISFAQNQSSGAVQSSISSPISQEIFRFRPGLVTQLDSGTSFGFTNSRWFSFGRLPTGSQTVYGLRFQLPNRAITMGYQDLNDENPRIQWIGASSFSGTDLEFRVANSFTSTSSRLVATMTNDGKTFFGDPLSANGTKVGIDYTDVGSTRIGLTVENDPTQGAYYGTGIKSVNNAGGYVKTGIDVQSVNGSCYGNTGISVKVSDGFYNNGVTANVTGATNSNVYGVRGSLFNNGNVTGFGAAVYGSSPITSNWHAGYFNGDVVINGGFTVTSDKKLKTNIKDEEDVLEKLESLDAVTYTFKPNKNINLPNTLQHGFIAQNLEEVFPELVKTVTKPIYDQDNQVIEQYEYKTVNYIGLISVLSSGIKELNEKVASLENQLETIQGNSNNTEDVKNSDFSMEQNIPNPFNDRTIINYNLPRQVNANITVFDMSGKFIKEYALTAQKGQVTISANDIGKGMFIYSLISGNQIMVTKKMIVK